MRALKTMDPGELSAELLREVESFDPEFVSTLMTAIEEAGAFHEGQWRKNRGHYARTQYIEHPLRCALRAVCAGVTDRDTLLSIIFHDAVEDQAERVVRLSGPDGQRLAGQAQGNPQRLRELALTWFGEAYGESVQEAINSVTNSLAKAGATKDQQRSTYARNVASKVRGSARTFVIKLMDFADNGSVLHHNDIAGNEEMVLHLATKYAPIPDILLEEMERNLANIEDMMSVEGIVRMRVKLVDTKERLADIRHRYGSKIG